MNALIVAIQLGSCFFMTGLIWMVQLVHYPSFDYIDNKQFKVFHDFHSSKITWIVLPVMGAELVSAILICRSLDPYAMLNLLSVIMIWIATLTVSVPLHNKLKIGYDPKWIKRLVTTNWIRTVLWSLRLVGLTAWLVARLSAQSARSVVFLASNNSCKTCFL